MNGPRDAVEQAILACLGIAALTKERVESVVADLVARGYLTAEDGTAIVARLLARVRGDGAPAQTGLGARVEDGARAAFRQLGLVSKSELDELRVRLAELERRLSLLEPPPLGD